MKQHVKNFETFINEHYRESDFEGQKYSKEEDNDEDYKIVNYTEEEEIFRDEDYENIADIDNEDDTHFHDMKNDLADRVAEQDYYMSEADCLLQEYLEEVGEIDIDMPLEIILDNIMSFYAEEYDDTNAPDIKPYLIKILKSYIIKRK